VQYLSKLNLDFFSEKERELIQEYKKLLNELTSQAKIIEDAYADCFLNIPPDADAKTVRGKIDDFIKRLEEVWGNLKKLETKYKRLLGEKLEKVLEEKIKRKDGDLKDFEDLLSNLNLDTRTLFHRILSTFYGRRQTAIADIFAYYDGKIEIENEKQMAELRKFILPYGDENLAKDLEIRNKFFEALGSNTTTQKQFALLNYYAQIYIAKHAASLLGGDPERITMSKIREFLKTVEGEKLRIFIENLSMIRPELHFAAAVYLTPFVSKQGNTEILSHGLSLILGSAQALYESNYTAGAINFLREVGTELNKIFPTIQDIKMENLKVERDQTTGLETFKIKITQTEQQGFTVNIPDLKININLPRTVYNSLHGYLLPGEIPTALPKTFEELRKTIENGEMLEFNLTTPALQLILPYFTFDYSKLNKILSKYLPIEGPLTFKVIEGTFGGTYRAERNGEGQWSRYFSGRLSYIQRAFPGITRTEAELSGGGGSSDSGAVTIAEGRFKRVNLNDGNTLWTVEANASYKGPKELTTLDKLNLLLPTGVETGLVFEKTKGGEIEKGEYKARIFYRQPNGTYAEAGYFYVPQEQAKEYINYLNNLGVREKAKEGNLAKAQGLVIETGVQGGRETKGTTLASLDGLVIALHNKPSIDGFVAAPALQVNQWGGFLIGQNLPIGGGGLGGLSYLDQRNYSIFVGKIYDVMGRRGVYISGISAPPGTTNWEAKGFVDKVTKHWTPKKVQLEYGAQFQYTNPYRNAPIALAALGYSVRTINEDLGDPLLKKQIETLQSFGTDFQFGIINNFNEGRRRLQAALTYFLRDYLLIVNGEKEGDPKTVLQFLSYAGLDTETINAIAGIGREKIEDLEVRHAFVHVEFDDKNKISAIVALAPNQEGRLIVLGGWTRNLGPLKTGEAVLKNLNGKTINGKERITITGGALEGRLEAKFVSGKLLIGTNIDIAKGQKDATSGWLGFLAGEDNKWLFFGTGGTQYVGAGGEKADELIARRMTGTFNLVNTYLTGLRRVTNVQLAFGERVKTSEGVKIKNKEREDIIIGQISKYKSWLATGVYTHDIGGPGMTPGGTGVRGDFTFNNEVREINYSIKNGEIVFNNISDETWRLGSGVYRATVIGKDLSNELLQGIVVYGSMAISETWPAEISQYGGDIALNIQRTGEVVKAYFDAIFRISKLKATR
ncbi:MAG: hypothetical protein QXI89_00270, partial [Candidatus Anstonellales archaeon]